MDISLKGKGAIPRSSDSRNVPFRATIFGIPEIDWDQGFDIRSVVGDISIKDQGSSQSCVGMAWAYYAYVMDRYETPVAKEKSARFLYSRIWVPPLGGSWGFKGGSVLVNLGIPDEELSPSYKTENEMRIQDYGPQVLNNALIHKAKSYAHIDTGNIDELAYAIKNNRGAVFGFIGSDKGFTTAFPRPPVSGESTWGHFVFATGYKLINRKKNIIFLNSWSNQWGDNGVGYLGSDYFDGGWTFNPLTLADLPNDWLLKIKMLDLIKLSESRDQWIVSAGFRYRLPDIETKNYYRDKLKIILDECRIVTKEEFDRLQDGGRIPSWLLDYKLSGFYSDLKDAMELDKG